MSKTFKQATSGSYDPAHEKALLDAVTQAILKTSRVSDACAIVLRSDEIMAALTEAIARFLALAPSTSKSPAAVFALADAFGRHLQQQAAAARQCPDANTDKWGSA
jgi:hypothetical protein